MNSAFRFIRSYLSFELDDTLSIARRCGSFQTFLDLLSRSVKMTLTTRVPQPLRFAEQKPKRIETVVEIRVLQYHFSRIGLRKNTAPCGTSCYLILERQ